MRIHTNVTIGLTNKTARKTPKHKVVRANITLPPRLWEAAQALVTNGGYVGLSDYVQARIRRDAGLEAFGQ